MHFVCVGTPQLNGSTAADLMYVDQVVTSLAQHLTRPHWTSPDCCRPRVRWSSVYDPQALDIARRAYPDLHYAESVAEAAASASVVAVLTEWDQFREIDPHWLGEIVQVRAIVDGRHALDPVIWRAAGWDYRALGRA